MCIFCKIIKGELPSQLVYEDAGVVAFNDIAPQAPIHVIVATKEHIPCASDVTDDATWGVLMGAAVRVAKGLGLAGDGYRLVINTGENGGQTVPHLHLHILGGGGIVL